MNQNKRIIINIAATYGRSLLSLVLGLLSGRWLLMSLGVKDYGLLSLIGGLAVLVTFVNGLFASAIGRFYAVVIGASKAKDDSMSGLEDCRKWFSTAVLIHTVIPSIMLIIGYPIGIWMIKNYLNIPVERIQTCVWVWRFTCILCYVNMVSIPFSAMFTAKQEIAELTIFNISQSLIMFCIVYYMVNHPADWLVKYTLFNMIVLVLLKFLICIRARFVYPECRLRLHYLYDADRLKKLLYFTGSKFWGNISQIVSQQFMSILVNKRLGVEKNATLNVGNTVSTHTGALASSLCDSFWPVVASSYGKGDLAAMKDFAMSACRFGTILSLIFVIPLSLEVENVLNIWLKTPPPQASIICLCVLTVSVINKLTDGHWMIVLSVGKIGKYEIACSFSGFLAFGFALLFCNLGMGILSVGLGLLFMQIYLTIIRIYFAQHIGGFSIKRWLFDCVCPIFVLTITSLISGSLVIILLKPTLFRVCLTTIISECTFVIILWLYFLKDFERTYIKNRIFSLKIYKDIKLSINGKNRKQ